MAKLIYSMNPSLDGFISGPDGNFDWSAPDEELHRFHNERIRALGGHLLGRRLYETMVYWETAHEDPAATDYMREFADIWQALPKVVFSKTLTEVVGNTRLARGGIAEEAATLIERRGKDIGIGGAELAGAAMKLGLVDEFRLFVKSARCRWRKAVLARSQPSHPPDAGGDANVRRSRCVPPLRTSVSHTLPGRGKALDWAAKIAVACRCAQRYGSSCPDASV